MNKMTVSRKFHVRKGRRGRKQMYIGPGKESLPAGRTPRVSQLMALAIRFEQLVRDGVVSDYADLARLGHVTRARVTQIMNLLNLAPDIQEAILFMPRVESGREPITERHLRPIAALMEWDEQRPVWQRLTAARKADRVATSTSCKQ